MSYEEIINLASENKQTNETTSKKENLNFEKITKETTEEAAKNQAAKKVHLAFNQFQNQLKNWDSLSEKTYFDF